MALPSHSLGKLGLALLFLSAAGNVGLSLRNAQLRASLRSRTTVPAAVADANLGRSFRQLHFASALTGDEATLPFPSERPTILYFVAESCEWCRINAEAADSFRRHSSGRSGFLVVIRGSQSRPSTSFVSSYAAISDSISEQAGPFLMKVPFSIPGTPYTVALDRSGRVVGSRLGTYSGSSPDDLLSALGLSDEPIR